MELKGADLLQVRQGECLIDTNIEFQIMYARKRLGSSRQCEAHREPFKL